MRDLSLYTYKNLDRLEAPYMYIFTLSRRNYHTIKHKNKIIRKTTEKSQVDPFDPAAETAQTTTKNLGL